MAALSAENQVVRNNIKTMIAKDNVEVAGNLMDNFSSSPCFFDDVGFQPSAVCVLSEMFLVLSERESDVCRLFVERVVLITFLVRGETSAVIN